ncbi:DNA primase [SCandidatus Aminicenantes bacterium Aminicenantia_JdfR_composite]|jgi:DNA primase|nr:DNA primase [SCandidatus Aminicenantes bacterium Aminicenantia_JdfR_composite]MCP2597771.1 DNA primase [Candidatus Aminicenantes bacterium AC-335-L06]MCP2605751.1 DNA primase [Candidatus Aminicenantes bacterium AC-335-O07]MCP2620496.1 DNA primase [Candidatus Aminicenantes bacterium AC-334-E05]
MEITDLIREKADIIELASQYTNLRQRGKRWFGLCPFHSEKTPSFTVDPEKKLYHCFGCGAGGDIFTLIMEKEKMSFWEAIKFLCQKYNIPLPEKSLEKSKINEETEELYRIHDHALKFFRKCLISTSEGKRALDYLIKRGIKKETIEFFKIGYAPKSWNSLYSYLIKQNIKPESIEKAGLIIPSQKGEGFYDRFRGRIIFPIFNLLGKVIAFGGRTVYDDEPKYLNSPETPIYSKGNSLYGLNWSKDYIRENKEAILVEGYMDLISLYQSGIKNVVASLGTSLTTSQLSLLQRFTKRVCVNYDSDQAGQSATLRSISLCLEKGLEVKISLLPEGYDPDSFVKEKGKDEYLNYIKDNNIPGFEFLCSSMMKSRNLDLPQEKSQLLRELVEIISKVPDNIVRSEYIKKLSEYFDIHESEIREIIKFGADKVFTEFDKEEFLPAEKRLLQIILEKKEIAEKIIPYININDIRGLKSERIFEKILNNFNNNKGLSIGLLKEEIDSSLISSIVQSMIVNQCEPSLEEAMDCLNTLKRLSLEKKLKEIQREINKLEKEGNSHKLNAYLELKQKIMKDLLALCETK